VNDSAYNFQERFGELTIKEKEELFRYLRKDKVIHPLEIEFGAPAEVILEAIARSSDLTKRGVRGIIAEASFKVEILNKQHSIKVLEIKEDEAFDFLVEYKNRTISIQVKMQRLKNKKPMLANEGYRFLPNNCFVVETQRTRGGKTTLGEDTRPYRFGEFDILAVSMQPSTKNWKDFRYALCSSLLPRPENQSLLLKFQPVSLEESSIWSTDLINVLDLFVSN
jgi:hypothetical protein